MEEDPVGALTNTTPTFRKAAALGKGETPGKEKRIRRKEKENRNSPSKNRKKKKGNRDRRYGVSGLECTLIDKEFSLRARPKSVDPVGP